MKNGQSSGDLEGFLDILGLDEAPMGVCYSDTEPEGGLSPKPQTPVSREAEEKGEVSRTHGFIGKQEQASGEVKISIQSGKVSLQEEIPLF